MDPVIVLLMIIMSVLSVLLVIVGVQVIIILKDLRVTLKHLNHTLKNTDNMVDLVNQSFTSLGNTFQGFKSGMQMMDAFFNWLKEHKGHDSRPLSE